MTILAGIFSPGGWTAQDQQLADEIRTHISRTDSDVREQFFDGTLFACKVDIGAYGEPAWHDDEAWFATLTGRPLLGGADRRSDLRSLCGPDPGRVIAAGGHGVFCALVYDKAARQLRLLTDPLGLRPFYVCEQAGRWLFSTSLRVIAALSMDLTLDLDGVSEVATLGYFLLDHTPYGEVRGAAPGACWTLDSTGLQRASYLAWQDLNGEPLGLAEGAAAVHAAFEAALSAGLAGGDGREAVSLSGSLNSRLIAAALKRRGVLVEGLAIAAADPVSRYCTSTFAREQGLALSLVDVEGHTMSLEGRVGHHWRHAGADLCRELARPRVVWTGKGGSVGMGVLPIDETDVELARWGDATKLADRFIERTAVALPPRIICNYRVLEQNLRTSLIASLGAFPGLSQERALMLFLTIQHQRRHFILQREEVDRHRVELHLPFCSPLVAWAALALAIEDMRDYHAYRHLIERYYPEVMASPWRSSPGHLPCPLPIPVKVKGRRFRRKPDPARRATLKRAWRLVREWQMPAGVLDRKGLALTCALTQAHLREGIYSLRLAVTFARWLQR